MTRVEGIIAPGSYPPCWIRRRPTTGQASRARLAERTQSLPTWANGVSFGGTGSERGNGVTVDPVAIFCRNHDRRDCRAPARGWLDPK